MPQKGKRRRLSVTNVYSKKILKLLTHMYIKRSILLCLQSSERLQLKLNKILTVSILNLKKRG